MTSDVPSRPYGDPLSRPFWESARQGRLTIQHCPACGQYQFYARPFCLNCQSDDVAWEDAAGTGTIYSLTTVRMEVLPEVAPPYQVALVELDEGPRFLTWIVGNDGCIGDRVEVRWHDREDLPPLPVFAVVRH
jgi:uncharacterized OB-fold protein